MQHIYLRVHTGSVTACLVAQSFASRDCRGRRLEVRGRGAGGAHITGKCTSFSTACHCPCKYMTKEWDTLCCCV